MIHGRGNRTDDLLRNPSHMDRTIVVNGNIGLQTVYVVAFDLHAALYTMKVSDNGVGRRSGLIEVSTNRYLCAKHKVLLSRAVGRRKAYWCAVFKDRGRAIYAGSQPQQQ